jgi:hypothetical protein
MAKKTRPSFTTSRGEGAGSKAGWVYRSEKPSIIDVPPAGTPEELLPARRVVPVRRLPRMSPERIDRAVMPLTLLMMTLLAPIGWLIGKKEPR